MSPTYSSSHSPHPPYALPPPLRPPHHRPLSSSAHKTLRFRVAVVGCTISTVRSGAATDAPAALACVPTVTAPATLAAACASSPACCHWNGSAAASPVCAAPHLSVASRAPDAVPCGRRPSESAGASEIASHTRTRDGRRGGCRARGNTRARRPSAASARGTRRRRSDQAREDSRLERPWTQSTATAIPLVSILASQMPPITTRSKWRIIRRRSRDTPGQDDVRVSARDQRAAEMRCRRQDMSKPSCNGFEQRSSALQPCRARMIRGGYCPGEIGKKRCECRSENLPTERKRKRGQSARPPTAI